MDFDKYKFTSEELIDIYKKLTFPRMIEEKMLLLLRQGKLSKWFSGIGQEAIAVGVTWALKPDEYILPLHRNLGVFTTRDIDLVKLFAQFLAKKESFTRGRDRSFHFGAKPLHIIGMISHLAAQLSVANGIALSDKIKNNKRVTLVFTGEGGTSEGEFHEALNVASVWKLPVIFFIENNGYALSTPVKEQFSCQSLADRGIGYGMKSISIDGNNVLEVIHTIKSVAEEIRKNPECVLIEANTFRIRGHEEASGTKYIPTELIEEWSKKDPIVRFEKYLVDNGFLKTNEIERIKSSCKKIIDDSWSKAHNLDEPISNSETEIQDVFAPSPGIGLSSDPTNGGSEKRFIDAISEGLDQSLEKFDNLILMGQDIAEYGGAFKVTEGLVKKYGKERIRNTPLCESSIIGMGLGLSIEGMKSIIEMQFADFVSCGFNQLVNNLAKSYYRWGQNSDVVIRMPTGAGLGAGPFHSQSTEAWFFHVPGLKIVYPSNPRDAKGLLLSAIADPNPVLYFEHKYLYRSVTGKVPKSIFFEPIGVASVMLEGNDLTVITYGLAVHWIMEIVGEFGVGEIEVIDLRTLMPWDNDTVFQSVKKTGKALIVHEDTLTGGIGAEISAKIIEECFEYLDGPVRRIGALDTPVPFNKSLEDDFLPKKRIKREIENLLDY